MVADSFFENKKHRGRGLAAPPVFKVVIPFVTNIL